MDPWPFKYCPITIVSPSFHDCPLVPLFHITETKYMYSISVAHITPPLFVNADHIISYTIFGFPHSNSAVTPHCLLKTQLNPRGADPKVYKPRVKHIGGHSSHSHSPILVGRLPNYPCRHPDPIYPKFTYNVCTSNPHNPPWLPFPNIALPHSFRSQTVD